MSKNLSEVFFSRAVHPYELCKEPSARYFFFKQKMQFLTPELFLSQERKVTFVQVVGTNGKGSFCHALAHDLDRLGLQTYLFTSPHLFRLQERFLVNLKPLPAIEFVHWQRRYGVYFPHFFERICAFAAWQIAYGSKVQERSVVILEAGLGARFDMTGVFASEIVVVTSIGEDHHRELGYTLDERVRQKIMTIGPKTELAILPAFLKKYSFVSMWLDFCHVPHIFYKNLEEARSLCALILSKDKLSSMALCRLAGVFIQSKRKRLKSDNRVRARLESLQTPWGPIIIDVAHNASALNFLCERLAPLNENFEILLSLEESRIPTVDRKQLGQTFIAVHGVDCLSKALQGSALVSKKGKKWKVDFPWQLSGILEGLIQGVNQRAHTLVIAGSFRFIEGVFRYLYFKGIIKELNTGLMK